MSNVIFMDEDGAYEMAPGEKPKRITGNLNLAELPPGDWRMTAYMGWVIFEDASGQSPAMTVDKDGNWETLKAPTDVASPVLFIKPRVVMGGMYHGK